ncbi:MAG: hypothetical protein V7776_22675 [Halopseudomonas aestusnigri]
MSFIPKNASYFGAKSLRKTIYGGETYYALTGFLGGNISYASGQASVADFEYAQFYYDFGLASLSPSLRSFYEEYLRGIYAPLDTQIPENILIAGSIGRDTISLRGDRFSGTRNFSVYADGGYNDRLKRTSSLSPISHSGASDTITVENFQNLLVVTAGGNDTVRFTGSRWNNYNALVQDMSGHLTVSGGVRFIDISKTGSGNLTLENFMSASTSLHHFGYGRLDGVISDLSNSKISHISQSGDTELTVTNQSWQGLSQIQHHSEDSSNFTLDLQGDGQWNITRTGAGQTHIDGGFAQRSFTSTYRDDGASDLELHAMGSNVEVTRAHNQHLVSLELAGVYSAFAQNAEIDLPEFEIWVDGARAYTGEVTWAVPANESGSVSSFPDLYFQEIRFLWEGDTPPGSVTVSHVGNSGQTLSIRHPQVNGAAFVVQPEFLTDIIPGTTIFDQIRNLDGGESYEVNTQSAPPSSFEVSGTSDINLTGDGNTITLGEGDGAGEVFVDGDGNSLISYQDSRLTVDGDGNTIHAYGGADHIIIRGEDNTVELDSAVGDLIYDLGRGTVVRDLNPENPSPEAEDPQAFKTRIELRVGAEGGAVRVELLGDGAPLVPSRLWVEQVDGSFQEVDELVVDWGSEDVPKEEDYRRVILEVEGDVAQRSLTLQPQAVETGAEETPRLHVDQVAVNGAKVHTGSRLSTSEAPEVGSIAFRDLGIGQHTEVSSGITGFQTNQNQHLATEVVYDQAVNLVQFDFEVDVQASFGDLHLARIADASTTLDLHLVSAGAENAYYIELRGGFETVRSSQVVTLDQGHHQHLQVRLDGNSGALLVAQDGSIDNVLFQQSDYQLFEALQGLSFAGQTDVQFGVNNAGVNLSALAVSAYRLEEDSNLYSRTESWDLANIDFLSGRVAGSGEASLNLVDSRFNADLLSTVGLNHLEIAGDSQNSALIHHVEVGISQTKDFTFFLDFELAERSTGANTVLASFVDANGDTAFSVHSTSSQRLVIDINGYQFAVPQDSIDMADLADSQRHQLAVVFEGAEFSAGIGTSASTSTAARVSVVLDGGLPVEATASGLGAPLPFTTTATEGYGRLILGGQERADPAQAPRDQGEDWRSPTGQESIEFTREITFLRGSTNRELRFDWNSTTTAGFFSDATSDYYDLSVFMGENLLGTYGEGQRSNISYDLPDDVLNVELRFVLQGRYGNGSLGSFTESQLDAVAEITNVYTLEDTFRRSLVEGVGADLSVYAYGLHDGAVFDAEQANQNLGANTLIHNNLSDYADFAELQAAPDIAFWGGENIDLKNATGLRFDGAGETKFLSVSGDTPFGDVTKDFTLIVEACLDRQQHADLDVISLFDYENGDLDGLRVYYNQRSNKLVADWGADKVFSLDAELTDGAKHQIAVRYSDNRQRVDLLVDGVSLATKNVAQPITFTETADARLAFARAITDDGEVQGQNFPGSAFGDRNLQKGALHAFSIYNKALTSTSLTQTHGDEESYLRDGGRDNSFVDGWVFGDYEFGELPSLNRSAPLITSSDYQLETSETTDLEATDHEIVISLSNPATLGSGANYRVVLIDHADQEHLLDQGVYSRASFEGLEGPSLTDGAYALSYTHSGVSGIKGIRVDFDGDVEAVAPAVIGLEIDGQNIDPASGRFEQFGTNVADAGEGLFFEVRHATSSATASLEAAALFGALVGSFAGLSEEQTEQLDAVSEVTRHRIVIEVENVTPGVTNVQQFLHYPVLDITYAPEIGENLISDIGTTTRKTLNWGPGQQTVTTFYNGDLPGGILIRPSGVLPATVTVKSVKVNGHIVFNGSEVVGSPIVDPLGNGFSVILPHEEIPPAEPSTVSFTGIDGSISGIKSFLGDTSTALLNLHTRLDASDSGALSNLAASTDLAEDLGFKEYQDKYGSSVQFAAEYANDWLSSATANLRVLSAINTLGNIAGTGEKFLGHLNSTLGGLSNIGSLSSSELAALFWDGSKSAAGTAYSGYIRPVIDSTIKGALLGATSGATVGFIAGSALGAVQEFVGSGLFNKFIDSFTPRSQPKLKLYMADGATATPGTFKVLVDGLYLTADGSLSADAAQGAEIIEAPVIELAFDGAQVDRIQLEVISGTVELDRLELLDGRGESITTVGATQASNIESVQRQGEATVLSGTGVTYNTAENHHVQLDVAGRSLWPRLGLLVNAVQLGDGYRRDGNSGYLTTGDSGLADVSAATVVFSYISTQTLGEGTVLFDYHTQAQPGEFALVAGTDGLVLKVQGQSVDLGIDAVALFNGVEHEITSSIEIVDGTATIVVFVDGEESFNGTQAVERATLGEGALNIGVDGTLDPAGSLAGVISQLAIAPGSAIIGSTAPTSYEVSWVLNDFDSETGSLDSGGATLSYVDVLATDLEASGYIQSSNPALFQRQPAYVVRAGGEVVYEGVIEEADLLTEADALPGAGDYQRIAFDYTGDLPDNFTVELLNDRNDVDLWVNNLQVDERVFATSSFQRDANGENPSRYVKAPEDVVGGHEQFTVRLGFTYNQNDFPQETQASLLSYAVEGQTNELLFISLNGQLVVDLQAQRMWTGYMLEDLFDGAPHDLTVSLDSETGLVEVYADGVHVASKQQDNFRVTPREGGVLLFGQEQDSLEGGFIAHQAFSGTYNNIEVFDGLHTPDELDAPQYEATRLLDLEALESFYETEGSETLNYQGSLQLNVSDAALSQRQLVVVRVGGEVSAGAQNGLTLNAQNNEVGLQADGSDGVFISEVDVLSGLSSFSLQASFVSAADSSEAGYQTLLSYVNNLPEELADTEVSATGEIISLELVRQLAVNVNNLDGSVTLQINGQAVPFSTLGLNDVQPHALSLDYDEAAGALSVTVDGTQVGSTFVNFGDGALLFGDGGRIYVGQEVREDGQIDPTHAFTGALGQLAVYEQAPDSFADPQGFQHYWNFSAFDREDGSIQGGNGNNLEFARLGAGDLVLGADQSELEESSDPAVLGQQPRLRVFADGQVIGEEAVFWGAPTGQFNAADDYRHLAFDYEGRPPEQVWVEYVSPEEALGEGEQLPVLHLDWIEVNGRRHESEGETSSFEVLTTYVDEAGETRVEVEPRYGLSANTAETQGYFVADTPVIDGQEKFTLKLNFAYDQNNFPQETIPVLFSYEAADQYNAFTLINYQGSLQLFVHGEFYDTGIDPAPLFDGLSHELTIAYDGAAQSVVFHVDGQEVSTITAPDLPPQLVTDGALIFGQEQDILLEGGFTPSEAFSGAYEHIAIYEGVVTPQEIADGEGLALLDVTPFEIDPVSGALGGARTGGLTYRPAARPVSGAINGENTISVNEGSTDGQHFVAEQDVLGGLEEFTLRLRFAGQADGATQTLVHYQGPEVDGQQNDFTLRWQANKLVVLFKDQPLVETQAFLDSSFADGNIHEVFLSYDTTGAGRANDLFLYLDGQRQELIGDLYGDGLLAPGGVFTLGAGGNGETFAGQWAGVDVYRARLTPDELGVEGIREKVEVAAWDFTDLDSQTGTVTNGTDNGLLFRDGELPLALRVDQELVMTLTPLEGDVVSVYRVSYGETVLGEGSLGFAADQDGRLLPHQITLRLPREVSADELSFELVNSDESAGFVIEELILDGTEVANPIFHPDGAQGAESVAQPGYFVFEAGNAIPDVQIQEVSLRLGGYRFEEVNPELALYADGRELRDVIVEIDGERYAYDEARLVVDWAVERSEDSEATPEYRDVTVIYVGPAPDKIDVQFHNPGLDGNGVAQRALLVDNIEVNGTGYAPEQGRYVLPSSGRVQGNLPLNFNISDPDEAGEQVIEIDLATIAGPNPYFDIYVDGKRLTHARINPDDPDASGELVELGGELPWALDSDGRVTLSFDADQAPDEVHLELSGNGPARRLEVESLMVNGRVIDQAEGNVALHDPDGVLSNGDVISFDTSGSDLGTEAGGGVFARANAAWQRVSSFSDVAAGLENISLGALLSSGYNSGYNIGAAGLSGAGSGALIGGLQGASLGAFASLKEVTGIGSSLNPASWLLGPDKTFEDLATELENNPDAIRENLEQAGIDPEAFEDPLKTAGPVALDLNRDGELDLISLSESLSGDTGVLADVDGDGAAEVSAWVGPQDGLLVQDLGGGDYRYAFIGPDNSQSDMAVLRDEYGSSLTSFEADATGFGIWQDLNSNATVDNGEFGSFADHGIFEIGLTPTGGDNTSTELSKILGTSVVATADGQNTTAYDLELAYLDLTEQEQAGINFFKSLQATPTTAPPSTTPNTGDPFAGAGIVNIIGESVGLLGTVDGSGIDLGLLGFNVRSLNDDVNVRLDTGYVNAISAGGGDDYLGQIGLANYARTGSGNDVNIQVGAGLNFAEKEAGGSLTAIQLGSLNSAWTRGEDDASLYGVAFGLANTRVKTTEGAYGNFMGGLLNVGVDTKDGKFVNISGGLANAAFKLGSGTAVNGQLGVGNLFVRTGSENDVTVNVQGGQGNIAYIGGLGHTTDVQLGEYNVTIHDRSGAAAQNDRWNIHVQGGKFNSNTIYGDGGRDVAVMVGRYNLFNKFGNGETRVGGLASNFNEVIQVGDGDFTSFLVGKSNLSLKVGGLASESHQMIAVGRNNTQIHAGNGTTWMGSIGSSNFNFRAGRPADQAEILNGQRGAVATGDTNLISIGSQNVNVSINEGRLIGGSFSTTLIREGSILDQPASVLQGLQSGVEGGWEVVKHPVNTVTSAFDVAQTYFKGFLGTSVDGQNPSLSQLWFEINRNFATGALLVPTATQLLTRLTGFPINGYQPNNLDVQHFEGSRDLELESYNDEKSDEINSPAGSLTEESNLFSFTDGYNPNLPQDSGYNFFAHTQSLGNLLAGQRAGIGSIYNQISFSAARQGLADALKAEGAEFDKGLRSVIASQPDLDSAQPNGKFQEYLEKIISGTAKIKGNLTIKVGDGDVIFGSAVNPVDQIKNFFSGKPPVDTRILPNNVLVQVGNGRSYNALLGDYNIFVKYGHGGDESDANELHSIRGLDVASLAVGRNNVQVEINDARDPDKVYAGYENSDVGNKPTQTVFAAGAYSAGNVQVKVGDGTFIAGAVNSRTTKRFFSGEDGATLFGGALENGAPSWRGIFDQLTANTFTGTSRQGSGALGSIGAFLGNQADFANSLFRWERRPQNGQVFRTEFDADRNAIGGYGYEYETYSSYWEDRLDGQNVEGSFLAQSDSEVINSFIDDEKSFELNAVPQNNNPVPQPSRFDLLKGALDSQWQSIKGLSLSDLKNGVLNAGSAIRNQLGLGSNSIAHFGKGDAYINAVGHNNLLLKVGDGDAEFTAFGSNNLIIRVGDGLSSQARNIDPDQELFFKDQVNSSEKARSYLKNLKVVIGNKNIVYNNGDSDDLIVTWAPTPYKLNPTGGLIPKVNFNPFYVAEAPWIPLVSQIDTFGINRYFEGSGGSLSSQALGSSGLSRLARTVLGVDNIGLANSALTTRGVNAYGGIPNLLYQGVNNIPVLGLSYLSALSNVTASNTLTALAFLSYPAFYPVLQLPDGFVADSNNPNPPARGLRDYGRLIRDNSFTRRAIFERLQNTWDNNPFSRIVVDNAISSYYSFVAEYGSLPKLLSNLKGNFVVGGQGNDIIVTFGDFNLVFGDDFDGIFDFDFRALVKSRNVFYLDNILPHVNEQTKSAIFNSGFVPIFSLPQRNLRQLLGRDVHPDGSPEGTATLYDPFEGAGGKNVNPFLEADVAIFRRITPFVVTETSFRTFYGGGISSLAFDGVPYITRIIASYGASTATVLPFLGAAAASFVPLALQIDDLRNVPGVTDENIRESSFSRIVSNQVGNSYSVPAGFGLGSITGANGPATLLDPSFHFDLLRSVSKSAVGFPLQAVKALDVIRQINPLGRDFSPAAFGKQLGGLLEGNTDNGNGDVIFASGVKNWLFGGAGNDIIAALGDRNRIFGGVNDDLAIAIGGNNTILTGEGRDFAVAIGRDNIVDTGSTDEADVVIGVGTRLRAYTHGGDDIVIGAGYRSDIITGAGDDIIISFGTSDEIWAGSGNDVVISFALNSLIALGDGQDYYYNAFGSGNFTAAFSGADFIDLGQGSTNAFDAGVDNDIIRGRKGTRSSVAFGGDGDDLIFLGGENVVYSGGNGSDIFVISAEVRDVSIVDINLNDTLLIGNGLTWRDLVFQQDGNDLVITVDRWNQADRTGQRLFDDGFGQTGRVTVDDYFGDGFFATDSSGQRVAKNGAPDLSFGYEPGSANVKTINADAVLAVAAQTQVFFDQGVGGFSGFGGQLAASAGVEFENFVLDDNILAGGITSDGEIDEGLRLTGLRAGREVVTLTNTPDDVVFLLRDDGTGAEDLVILQNNRGHLGVVTIDDWGNAQTAIQFENSDGTLRELDAGAIRELVETSIFSETGSFARTAYGGLDSTVANTLRATWYSAVQQSPVTVESDTTRFVGLVGDYTGSDDAEVFVVPNFVSEGEVSGLVAGDTIALQAGVDVENVFLSRTGTDLLITIYDPNSTSNDTDLIEPGELTVQGFFGTNNTAQFDLVFSYDAGTGEGYRLTPEQINTLVTQTDGIDIGPDLQPDFALATLFDLGQRATIDALWESASSAGDQVFVDRFVTSGATGNSEQDLYFNLFEEVLTGNTAVADAYAAIKATFLAAAETRLNIELPTTDAVNGRAASLLTLEGQFIVIAADTKAILQSEAPEPVESLSSLSKVDINPLNVRDLRFFGTNRDDTFVLGGGQIEITGAFQVDENAVGQRRNIIWDVSAFDEDTGADSYVVTRNVRNVQIRQAKLGDRIVFDLAGASLSDNLWFQQDGDALNIWVRYETDTPGMFEVGRVRVEGAFSNNLLEIDGLSFWHSYDALNEQAQVIPLSDISALTNSMSNTSLTNTAALGGVNNGFDSLNDPDLATEWASALNGNPEGFQLRQDQLTSDDDVYSPGEGEIVRGGAGHDTIYLENGVLADGQKGDDLYVIDSDLLSGNNTDVARILVDESDLLVLREDTMSNFTLNNLLFELDDDGNLDISVYNNGTNCITAVAQVEDWSNYRTGIAFDYNFDVAEIGGDQDAYILSGQDIQIILDELELVTSNQTLGQAFNATTTTLATAWELADFLHWEDRFNVRSGTNLPSLASIGLYTDFVATTAQVFDAGYIIRIDQNTAGVSLNANGAGILFADGLDISSITVNNTNLEISFLGGGTTQNLVLEDYFSSIDNITTIFVEGRIPSGAALVTHVVPLPVLQDVLLGNTQNQTIEDFLFAEGADVILDAQLPGTVNIVNSTMSDVNDNTRQFIDLFANIPSGLMLDDIGMEDFLLVRNQDERFFENLWFELDQTSGALEINVNLAEQVNTITINNWLNRDVGLRWEINENEFVDYDANLITELAADMAAYRSSTIGASFDPTQVTAADESFYDLNEVIAEDWSEFYWNRNNLLASKDTTERAQISVHLGNSDLAGDNIITRTQAMDGEGAFFRTGAGDDTLHVNGIGNFYYGGVGENPAAQDGTLTSGSDTFVIDQSVVSATIMDFDADDTLVFNNNIDQDRIWFRKLGSNLEIEIDRGTNGAEARLGTVLVADYFDRVGDATEILWDYDESTDEGTQFTQQNLRNLVQAMAGESHGVAGSANGFIDSNVQGVETAQEISDDWTSVASNSRVTRNIGGF